MAEDGGDKPKRRGAKKGNIESITHRQNKSESRRNPDYYVKPDGSWNMTNDTVKKIVAGMTTNLAENKAFGPLRDQLSSKMMADGGKKLALADALLKLGQSRPKPHSSDELLERLYEYFAICQHQELPPTYPLFAVWCGMCTTTLEGNYAVAFDVVETVKVCKETIRGFIELSAMDNTLSPLIYFHQQKVYFGAVETQRVQVETTTTPSERLAEIEALVGSLKAPIEVENLSEC